MCRSAASRARTPTSPVVSGIINRTPTSPVATIPYRRLSPVATMYKQKEEHP